MVQKTKTERQTARHKEGGGGGGGGDRTMDEGQTDRQTDTLTILKTFHGGETILYRSGATKNENFGRPYISNLRKYSGKLSYVYNNDLC